MYVCVPLYMCMCVQLHSCVLCLWVHYACSLIQCMYAHTGEHVSVFVCVCVCVCVSVCVCVCVCV